MIKKRSFFTRLFIVLFTISVGAAVLPCGLVNTYGLFGEIRTSTVTEDSRRADSAMISVYTERSFPIKKIPMWNAWLLIAAVIISIILISYMLRLPRDDTIVTLRVRMDN